MNILQCYVEWACQLQYGGIPKDAVLAARNAVIDTIAAMLAGSNEPVSQKLLAYEIRAQSTGAATAVGSRYRFSPASAALINGTMAHALDYDDVLTSTRSHPSAVVVPAVMALGETLKSTGAQVIVAYLAGLEAIDKIGSLVAFVQYAKGWHTTSTLGVLGATAGAGKLLGLSEQQMRMGLGIAASMAGGLQKNFGTMTKPLHVGWAAQSGIVAATLAADGFTASDDVFSGKDNYLEVLAQKTDIRSMPSFGAPFAVLSPGLHVKRYPCCFATHRALDAVLSIREKFPTLDVDKISAILCVAPAQSFTALIHNSPTTGMEGKFSMQYAVSAALVDGRINVRSFTDEMVNREKLRQLMIKVRKVEDDQLPITDPDGTDRRFTDVSVEMMDGHVFKNRVDRPKGSADVPLTDKELGEKFVECSTGVLPPGQQEITLAMLRELESVGDISELIAHLRTNDRVVASERDGFQCVDVS